MTRARQHAILRKQLLTPTRCSSSESTSRAGNSRRLGTSSCEERSSPSVAVGGLPRWPRRSFRQSVEPSLPAPTRATWDTCRSRHSQTEQDEGDGGELEVNRLARARLSVS